MSINRGVSLSRRTIEYLTRSLNCADCCPTGNRVVFQIPTDSCGTGHKQRAHFNFSSDGVGDLAREEPGLPTPTVPGQGVVYDFPKQVIKLRIGKTVEMPGRKSRFEYQFITPVASHKRVVPTTDTRTAQCMPTCGPRQLPLCQELTEEEKLDLRMSCSSTEDSFLSDVFGTTSVTTSLFDLDAIQLPSTVSLTHSTKNRSVRFPDDSLYTQKPNWIPQRDTTVYMTLLNEFCRLRQSGTQATASVNKCLQAYCKQAPQSSRGGASAVPSSTDLWSNYTRSTVPASTYGASHLKYADVYFFGRSNDDPGKNREQKSNVRAGHVSSTRGEHHKYKPSKEAQTLASRASSTGTSTVKSVSIKENKACHSKPCPGRSSKNGISATVSHIRIGPRGSIGPCPVHGKEPCCGSPAPPNENEALVKVTTGANPRRGVFEIVIRRITGAPLAKNELMLEWTPPPSRGPPCGAPCGPPCLPPSCRPSKCRVVGCRSCKIKCCKRPCKKPCAIPCKPSPCKKCCKPPRCGKPCGQPAPCRSCGPCGKCRACSPPPCPPSPCCGGPCSSVPCLRPCPVGRKKPRRCRSQPRVRAHRKRSSPCHNRSPSCPVVRCRSTPAPCGGCPPACPPPLCPPRRCCSVSPCKPLSRCSSCCK